MPRPKKPKAEQVKVIAVSLSQDDVVWLNKQAAKFGEKNRSYTLRRLIQNWRKESEGKKQDSRIPITAWVETDTTGRLVKIDNAFSQLCGYSFDEIKGRKANEFLAGPMTDSRESAKMRQAIKAGEALTVPEIVNYRKDGSAYRVRIEISPRLRDGKLVGFSALETELI